MGIDLIRDIRIEKLNYISVRLFLFRAGWRLAWARLCFVPSLHFPIHGARGVDQGSSAHPTHAFRLGPLSLTLLDIILHFVTLRATARRARVSLKRETSGAFSKKNGLAPVRPPPRVGSVRTCHKLLNPAMHSEL